MAPDSSEELLRVVGFAAGVVSGVARVGVGHPFDTLKVLKQTGHGDLPSWSWSALARLYRGCGPPLLTVGVTSCMNFGIYENARLSFRSALQPTMVEQDIAIVFAAGTFGGSVLAIPTCPLANVQVLQQTAPSQRSMVEWVAHLVRSRGLRALYRGMTPHVVQAGIGRGFYMAGYEGIKIAEEVVSPDMSKTLSGQIIAAACGGISGWVFTYPFDVVRTNLIADWKGARFRTTLGTFRILYSRGGVRKLYAGLSYTVIRSVPVAVVTLPTYDLTKGALLRFFIPESQAR